MAETFTRGAVTLTPAVVIPGRLTRASRSVVHEIIGDAEPDVTERAAASRSGDVQLVFATAAAAASAYAALSLAGGAWTVDGTVDLDGSWKIAGEISYEPTGDAMRSRLLTVALREVTP